MKLSTTLLQAITLGVTVTTLAATTVSCEKESIKATNERIDDSDNSDDPKPESCPACGMG